MHGGIFLSPLCQHAYMIFMLTCNLLMSTCDKFMHVNVPFQKEFKTHVNINNLQVNLMMLNVEISNSHVNIIALALI